MRTILTPLLFAGLFAAACHLSQPSPGGGGHGPVVQLDAPRLVEGPTGLVEWMPDLAAWLKAQQEEADEQAGELSAATGGPMSNPAPASPGTPARVGGRESEEAASGDDWNFDAPFDSDSSRDRAGAPMEEADLGELELRGLGSSAGRPDEALAIGGGAGGGFRGPSDTVAPKKAEQDAQASATWQRASAQANAVSLFVGDEDKLPLDGIEARAWVDGMRARVLLDCVFTNDRDQELEGNFKLRLPEGASPYYLAFGEDVIADGSDWHTNLGDRSTWQGPEPEAVLGSREERWRGAREARMVPRGQAARAYKAEVRKSVDPALLEWAGAGIFQARVFPLLPQSRHRVVIGYELDLTSVPGTTDEYELALDFPTELAALGLELSALTPAGVVGELLAPAAAAESWVSGERQVLSWPSTDVRSFRLRLDLGAEAGLAALQSSQDSGYFALDLPIELGATTGGGWLGSPSAIFALDTSLSAAADFATQLDLLEAILTANRGHLDRFAVLFFDVAPRWWQPGWATNDAATVAGLLAECRLRSLEGATDLAAALAEAAHPAWAPGIAGQQLDLFLLSDGAATWGPADGRAIARGLGGGLVGPLFAYSTGKSGTDRRALELLTRETGGALFSLAGPADLARAATAHHGAPWVIESLGLGGARGQVQRGRPNPVVPGPRLRLLGRGTPGVGDVLTLDLSQGGQRRSIQLPIARSLPTPLAARAYGVVTTPQLEEFGRETRAAAEAFATHFRVAGKAASLLMLEDEQAYANQRVLGDADLELARTASARALVAAALERMAGDLDDPALALLELLEPLAEGGGLGDVPGLGGAPRAGTGGPPGRRPAVQPGTTVMSPGGPVVVQAPAPTGPVATLLLPAEFTAALATLPPSALVVGPGDLTPLPLSSPWARDVPSDVAEALASGEPAYDLIQAAAAERLASLGRGDALRLVSSFTELNPGDGVFARDVAQTLSDWGLHGHAYHLLLRVAEQRPFEPQSYLSLARAAEELGKGDLAMFWYTVSLSGKWEQRFGDFHQIAAFDAMHFLRRVARGEVQVLGSSWLETGMPGLAEAVTPISLAEELEFAVAIQWNTDSTDIDLHVVDPAGEHCYYGHRDTAGGGHLSRDVTGGYGPELYTIPLVDEGEYLVFARFFASNPNRTSVRTKVLATVYQAWGTADEVVERRVIELQEATEQHGIIKLTVR
ncbi:MAG: hypothetical protein P1V81_16310 [Planctomycetota bacterium]|nr:hypothetical protein [Planctomycetota bacterium]